MFPRGQSSGSLVIESWQIPRRTFCVPEFEGLQVPRCDKDFNLPVGKFGISTIGKFASLSVGKFAAFKLSVQNESSQVP